MDLPPRVRSSLIAENVKQMAIIANEGTRKHFSNHVPSNFMPVFKHLLNLQAGHFFRVAMEIGQDAPRKH